MLLPTPTHLYLPLVRRRGEDMLVTVINLHLYITFLFELKYESILGYPGYGRITPVHDTT